MQSIKMESESKNKEYLKLVVVLVVLFSILGGFLLYVSYPLLGTKTVVLATQPVDPFDLIRGQYITIRYEIGSIPIISGAESGDDIFIEYGIEQYFFERGAKFSTRGITVKVKLSDAGGARIVGLLEDGKPIKIAYENKTLTS